MTTEEIIEKGNIVYDQRDISPSELGVTSRQINEWIEEKIVPFVERQGDGGHTDGNEEVLIEGKPKVSTKWIRLNLAQAVWVCIVRELFRMNVPLEKLQILAEKVWQQPREDKYADDVLRGHIEKNPYGLNNDEIQQLNSILEEELLMEHYFRTIINPFTDIVKSALWNDRVPHSMLYVPETNDFKFHSGDKNLMINLGSVYLQHPMVSLPLMPIIAEVLSVEFYNTKKRDLGYLTYIEKQIRDIVVFKRPKEVEIAFEDGIIKPIVLSEKHKTREQLAQYILTNKIGMGTKLLIDIRSQDNYKITLIKK